MRRRNMFARTRRQLLLCGSAAIVALALLWSGYSHTQAQSPTGTGQRFLTTDNGTIAILIPLFGRQIGVNTFGSQTVSSQVGGTTGTSAGEAQDQTGAANQPSTNQAASTTANAANNAANSATGGPMSALEAMANASLVS